MSENRASTVGSSVQVVVCESGFNVLIDTGEGHIERRACTTSAEAVAFVAGFLGVEEEPPSGECGSLHPSPTAGWCCTKPLGHGGTHRHDLPLEIHFWPQDESVEPGDTCWEQPPPSLSGFHCRKRAGHPGSHHAWAGTWGHGSPSATW